MPWKSGVFAFVFVVGVSVAAFAQDTQDSDTVRLPEEQVMDLAESVLLDVQSTWQQMMPDTYQPTRIVLYRDTLDGSCGDTSAIGGGPFYCGADDFAYLDLGFVHGLKAAYPAPADFAEAYIVAHEVGHHVQRLLGVEGSTDALELQADCFAGVWAQAATQAGRADQGLVQLDASQADDALIAATATGNARFQVMSTGAVAPETFTHATSEQRAAAFHAGLDSGSPAACTIPTAR